MALTINRSALAQLMKVYESTVKIRCWKKWQNTIHIHLHQLKTVAEHNASNSSKGSNYLASNFMSYQKFTAIVFPDADTCTIPRTRQVSRPKGQVLSSAMKETRSVSTKQTSTQSTDSQGRYICETKQTSTQSTDSQGRYICVACASSLS